MFWFAGMSCQRTVVYTTRSTRVEGERCAAIYDDRFKNTPPPEPVPTTILGCGPQACPLRLTACGDSGRSARSPTYLFNLKHPLESELLHRESRIARILCPKAARTPAPATSQPSAADSEPVLAEGRSVAPALLARYCAGPSGPPPTPTRVRHADNRRKLGEAPPPECTAMRSAAGSIPGSGDTRALGAADTRHTHCHDSHGSPRTGRKERDEADRSHRTCYGKR
ncbi:unnamed protein product [Euphydryas editha]|uniref:Uncharacterized protein n=1 Tax=Euphydryas editha TaxID=104508 RepID=A0AAU9TBX4_EUPED|nr:unnamed protein product [Euphydryas editha]